MNTFLTQPNHRIAFKLMLLTVLFSTCITIITSAFQLRNDYKKDKQAIENRLDEVGTVHLKSITSRMWISDVKELEVQLKSILEYPEINYIEVMENDNSVIKLGKKMREDVISKKYVMNYSHRNKTIKLGDLIVQASLQNATQQVISQIWSILISNAIKIFFVTGFIVYLFYYLVTRHIEKISNFAQTLNIDNLGKELVLDRKQHVNDDPDELDTLVSAISKMKKNLQYSIQELKQSEETNRLLLDSSGEGIFGIDRQGNCTFVNKTCLALLAYEKEDDILNQNMVELIQYNGIDNKRRHEQESKLHQVLINGVGIHCDDELFMRGDGKTFPTEYRAFPINRDNKIVGVVVTFVDISVRKENELELEVYQQNLANMVDERTIDLTNANKELEAFCYTVSHDLRAPLRAMSGFSKILQEDFKESLDDTAFSYLNRICNGVERMDNLITDLLTLSRMSKKPINLKTVNLSELAKHRIAQLRLEEPRRDVIANISNNLTVQADPTLMSEVIINLIDNAWKYTQKNAQALIEFNVETRNGKNVYYVRDNGIGFEMKYSNKLFSVFQRLHKQDDFKGNGVGLAIVDRIIDKHGGHVWAESELNKGATFFFDLKEQCLAEVAHT